MMKMEGENYFFLLALKSVIMAFSEDINPTNHTLEGQERRGNDYEMRDNSNLSHEVTQGDEASGNIHQEVCESKKKEEKERQIMLCKRNVKRNFVWRQCSKRNVKKLFSGRRCRPG